MQDSRVCKSGWDFRRSSFLCEASSSSPPLSQRRSLLCDTPVAVKPNGDTCEEFADVCGDASEETSLFESVSVETGVGACVGRETKRAWLGRLAECVGDIDDSSFKETLFPPRSKTRHSARGAALLSSGASLPVSALPLLQPGEAEGKAQELKRFSSMQGQFGRARTGRKGGQTQVHPLVGEMAALFHNAAFAKQRRAAAGFREAVFKDAQIVAQLRVLHSRLASSLSESSRKRGEFVKIRSLELDRRLYEASRSRLTQRKKLPANWLVPLPAFKSEKKEEDAAVGKADSRVSRLWIQLKSRWKVSQKRRRTASLPPHSRGFSDDWTERTSAALPSELATLLTDKLDKCVALRRSVSEAQVVSCKGLSATSLLGAGCFARVNNAAFRSVAESVLEKAPKAAASASQSDASRLVLSVNRFTQLLALCVKISQNRLKVALYLQSLRPTRRLKTEGAFSFVSEKSPSLQLWGSGFTQRTDRTERQSFSECRSSSPESKQTWLISECEQKTREASLSLAGPSSTKSEPPSLESRTETAESGSEHLCAPSLESLERACEAMLGRELLSYERLLLRLQFLQQSDASLREDGSACGESLCSSLISQILSEDEAFLGSASPSAFASQPEGECLSSSARGSAQLDSEEDVELLLRLAEALRGPQSGCSGEGTEGDESWEAGVSFFSQEEAERVSAEEEALRLFFTQGPSLSTTENPFASVDKLAALESEEQLSVKRTAENPPSKTDGCQLPPTPKQDFPPLDPTSVFSGKKLYNAHLVVGPWRSSLLLAETAMESTATLKVEGNDKQT